MRSWTLLLLGIAALIAVSAETEVNADAPMADVIAELEEEMFPADVEAEEEAEEDGSDEPVAELLEVSEEKKRSPRRHKKNLKKKQKRFLRRSVNALRKLATTKASKLRLARAKALKKRAHLRRLKRVARSRKFVKRSFKRVPKKVRVARRKARKARKARRKARRSKRAAARAKVQARINKLRTGVKNALRRKAAAARKFSHLRRALKALSAKSLKMAQARHLALKNIAYLKKVAAKMKAAKRKLPAVYFKKMAALKKKVAKLGAAQKKLHKKGNKMLKAYIASKKARATQSNLARKLKAKLNNARKSHVARIRKAQAKARRVAKFIARAVAWLRKKGKKWYRRTMGKIIKYAHTHPKRRKALLRYARRFAKLARLAFGMAGTVRPKSSKFPIGKAKKKGAPKPKKAAPKPKKAAPKPKKAAPKPKKAAPKPKKAAPKPKKAAPKPKKAAPKPKKAARKPKKAAPKPKKAKKVSVSSTHNSRINGCVQANAVLAKQVATDDKLRAKELKVLRYVRAKLLYLGSLQTEDKISPKEDEEMAAMLESLDITRKHAEVVGHGGILALLKQLKNRLNAEHHAAHTNLARRRRSCADKCATGYLSRLVAKRHADRTRRAERKALFKVNASLNKARGAAKGAAQEAAKDKKRHAVASARAKRELALLDQLTAKLDELEGVKTVELQTSDQDMLTALQEMREMRHDDADVRATLVEMTRKNPSTARIRLLLRSLRAKLLNEVRNSGRTLRKNFRAARHYRRKAGLLKMAQKGAKDAHRLAVNRLRRARRALSKVVRECNGANWANRYRQLVKTRRGGRKE